MEKNYIALGKTKKKNYSLIFFLISLILFTSLSATAQCTGCTVTGPTSGNFTFSTGQVVCFTSNAVLSDVTFQTGSKMCVAPGVTVIIQNNINSSGNIKIEVHGTLQTNQPVTFNANVDILVASGGTLKGGSSGTTNFNLNGPGNNLFVNRGDVQVGVISFLSATATNIIDNYDQMDIHNNINISGVTRFRNNGNLIIGASFNNNSQSNFINCAYFEAASGFNLGGGFVINTGNFRVLSQRIDYGGSSARMENYGTVYVNGVINLGGGGCVYYNEGRTELTSSFQNDGNITGPTSSSKRGYFVWSGKAVMNNGTIGPNLDLKNSSGTSNASSMFNNLGGVTIQPSISFDCASSTNCTAPLVTTGAVCRNPDGSIPCNITNPGNINGSCSGGNNLVFTLNLTGTNIGATYNVAGATPSTGTYGVATIFTIANGADGTNKSVIVTDGSDSNCNTSITIIGASCSADMKIEKTVNNLRPLVGSKVTFTLTATNLGPANATGVVVHDALPSGYIFLSSSTTTGSYNTSNGNWTIGNLANNGIAVLTITAKVKRTGSYLNTATVSSTTSDPVSTNNNANATVSPKRLLVTNPMIHQKTK